MIKQFEINAYVKKQLQAYLADKNLSLKAAMDHEDSNREVAAIIHAGLPAMVQKIYSLNKMQTFFWEKKDLLHDFVLGRLEAPDTKKGGKKKNK